MSVYIVNDPKGKGHYTVKINIPGEKRTQRTVPTMEIAEALKRKIEAQIELGTFTLGNPDNTDKTEIPTVDEYTVESINRMYPASRKAATNERYHSVHKKDIKGGAWPKIGDKKLNEVTAMDIFDLICSLVDDGRTSKSIDLTRTVLRCCFKVAKLNKVITENPMDDLPRMKYEENDTNVVETADAPSEIDPFAEEQMIIIIDAAMEYSPEVYGPLFLCGFRTGMRLGEMLALRWEDIDWQLGVIKVYRGYRRAKIGKTKTRKYRKVEMSNQLHTVLQDLYTRKVADAEAKGVNIQPIIFHCKGRYRSQNTVRKAFKKILKITGMPDKRVHDMRHTFASVLLSKGGSLAYIKAQLGHSKLSTTSDLYARFIPGTNRGMVTLLDSPIGLEKSQLQS
jgi:integrase